MAQILISPTTFEIWPWGKVMAHPWVMENDCLKQHRCPTLHEGVLPRQGLLLCAQCDLDLGDKCGSRSWTIIVWNIEIKLHSKELRSEQGLWLYVQCELDNMTLVQGHDTPLDHGKQLCEILSKYNITVVSWAKEWSCVCTVTLEIWHWVMVMTCPWVEDNNQVKYYPDPTWQQEVTTWTRILDMCALWSWPWRYDLGSRSWHTLRFSSTVSYKCGVRIRIKGSGRLLFGIFSHSLSSSKPDIVIWLFLCLLFWIFIVLWVNIFTIVTALYITFTWNNTVQTCSPWHGYHLHEALFETSSLS